jgi:hypothetical protein
MARPPRSNRAPWSPSLDEAEALEYAQNTKFNTFVDGIAADPSGRGRTPALSAVTGNTASAEQIATAQTQALDELAAKGQFGEPMYRTNNPEAGETEIRPPGADPYNPELGDSSENMPAPFEVGKATNASPMGLYKDSNPTAPRPGQEPPPAPPEPGMGQPSASQTRQVSETAQAAPRQAQHVQAPAMGKVDPGPAPESETDTLLRNLPGAAAYFIEMADQRKGGPNVEKRMQGYTDQNMDRNAAVDQERKQYGRRKAALERAAQREFQAGTQAAERENYKRDESLRVETKGDQRYEQDRAEDQRRYQTAEQRWQSANSPEAREATRQAEMGDRKELIRFGTDENIRQAQALAKSKRSGGGPGRANVQQAYAGALDALAKKHGGVDKIPPMERQQLDLAAQSKDAIGALRQVTSGYVTRDTAQASKDAGVEAKAKAARGQADNTLVEMDRLIATAKQERDKGQKYVPGKEPLVGDGGLAARYKRGKAMLMGDPERGSTGFTPDQALIANGYQLAAQADFHAQTGQTANMAAERERAEAAFANNNSMDGFIRELEVRRARLAGAIANGTYVPRDENGNALTMSAPAQEQTPQAPAPAQRVRAQDGDEIELVD